MTILDDRSSISRMNESPKKESILEAGLSLMMEKGYNHTGLKEILSTAGIPKGSFYHFFPSKEAFGLEVMNYYAAHFDPLLEQHFSQSQKPPLKRLRDFFEAVIKILVKENECRGGCLVGNLGQELADQNPVFREKANSVIKDWEGQFAACLREAQDNGELSKHLDAAELALFMINSWEGAILRMKLMKSPRPLQSFVNVVFDTVLVS